MNPYDLALLYQLRIEALSASVAHAIFADIEAAIWSITAAMLRKSVDGQETFQFARYVALRGQLMVLRDALLPKITGALSDGLDATVRTARVAVDRELASAARGIGLSIDFGLLPVDKLLAVADIPHDGFTWTRWGQKLGQDTLTGVESALRQGIALGQSVKQTAKKVADVAEAGKAGAERLTRTALTATANRARFTQWQSPSVRRYADAWFYAAVLDRRVSAVCASLHGKIFSLDDADAPFPPRHPNCRSTMMLVWKDGAGKFDRAHFEKMGTGEDWLRGLSPDRQREILGRARFEAFKSGTPLGSVVTYDRPLSGAELKAMYPEGAAQ